MVHLCIDIRIRSCSALVRDATVQWLYMEYMSSSDAMIIFM
jgi:hypothetical protein